MATGAGSVVLRLARNVAAGQTFGLADGDVIAGHLDDAPVRFTEGGLVFEADVRRGQKTGPSTAETVEFELVVEHDGQDLVEDLLEMRVVRREREREKERGRERERERKTGNQHSSPPPSDR